MATTPASLVPATSNGSTAADLAATSGVSQADVMAEQSKFPDLNPDAIIGNILTNRAKAPVAPPAVPPPVAVTGEQAQSQFTKDGNVLDQTVNERNSATANPTTYETPKTDTATEQTPEAKQLADLSAQYDTDYQTATSKLDALQATADEQNAQLIQSIKDSYALRKQQQEQLNRGLVGSTVQAGIRAGRNKYAPEMEQQLITSAESDGIARLSALDAEQSSLILQAQMAKNDKDFERLNASISMLKDNADRKRQAVLDLHQLQMDTDANLRAKAQDARDQARFEFDVEQAAQKPIQEAEKAAQDFMYDLALKYPDAGVLAADTVEQATAKIKESPAYKADLAYTLAQATAKETGGTVSDTTIRGFAQSLLQNGLATSPYEADALARRYYSEGYVPEQPVLGAGTQSVVEGAQRLASRNSEAQQGALMRSVNEKMASGDIQGATMDVYTNAISTLPATTQEKAFGYVQSLNNLDDIESLLSEYKAAGGETGIFTGTAKAINDKLKKTNDPKLLEIGNRITLAMSDYRRSQSGAAFTASEEKLYKEAFPSTFGSETYNATKIKTLRDAFNTGLKSQLQTVLGSDVYGKMETMRVAETKRPELEKKASANGYDAGDVQELIKEGFSADEIEKELSKKTSEGSVSSNARNDIRKVTAAIGQYESGGNYKALGPTVTSGMYKGDRAYGKYQVMGKNVPSWTKAALGRSMTPQEFLNDPAAQDKVAEYYMGMHLAKYGNLDDVASVWFSGRPANQAGNAKDVIGTTVPKYIKNVQAIYDKLS